MDWLRSGRREQEQDKANSRRSSGQDTRASAGLPKLVQHGEAVCQTSALPVLGVLRDHGKAPPATSP